MTVKTYKNKSIEKKLNRFISQLSDTEIKVGWFESSKYENGTSVASVALVQEFGSPKDNIPPRPFMRTTIKKEEKNWDKLINVSSKEALNGNLTGNKFAERLGLIVSGHIKKSIRDVQEPPLKESTIRNRVSRRANKKLVGNLTKPLIDTGIMINTLTYVVDKK